MTYFIGKPEYHDSIYGDQLPVCMTEEEIRDLAIEWNMYEDDLLDQFREADEDDIQEWGISDYRPDIYTVKELIEALQKCPQDFYVDLHAHGLPSIGVQAIAIDHHHNTVDLYSE